MWMGLPRTSCVANTSCPRVRVTVTPTKVVETLCDMITAVNMGYMNEAANRILDNNQWLDVMAPNIVGRETDMSQTCYG